MLNHVRGLEAQWDRVASEVVGEVSVELRTPDGPVASRHAGTRHYAASTLKLAILAVAMTQITAGQLGLDDELEIANSFPSASGGFFTLRQLDDEDGATWQRRGDRLPVDTLLERMIVKSSNLATNTILQEVTLTPVSEMVASTCGDEMTVNRFIGDERAEARGLTNTVSARGLGLLLSKLVEGTLLSPEATNHAIKLLSRQEHRRMIPAGLPPGTWSASKGGWTPDVRHDVAMVRPDRTPSYVLAICTTTGLDDMADGLVAHLSAVTWEHWSQWHAS